MVFSIMLATVVFMVRTPLNRFSLTAGLLGKITKRFPLDYSLLKRVHNLTAAGLLLIVFHVMLALPVQETLVRSTLMGGMGGLALLVFTYHKGIRPAICYLRAGRVSAVRRLSPAITEIEIQPHGSRFVRHRPGQFCYFRFLSSVCGYAEHPFTMSSDPGAERLLITVKDLGDYSGKLAHLPVGVRVLADGPYGVFTPRDSEDPLLFVAGGIGITPFLSILRHYRKHGLSRRICLIWSVHDPGELVALEELHGMQSHDGLLQVEILVTGGINPVSGKKDGRLDALFLEPRVRALGKGTLTVYLCGPESFRRGTVRALQALGIHRTSIHFEKFT